MFRFKVIRGLLICTMLVLAPTIATAQFYYKCEITLPFSCGSWADNECPCNSLCVSGINEHSCGVTFVENSCSETSCSGYCEQHSTEICFDFTREYCEIP